MHQVIIDHIKQLEKDQNITILLAAESGSRAWGCPSPDSDYDVRIIFKRPLSHYLEIDDRSDSIDYFHGKLLDINGWDIKKTLKLIRKSNATPFEWIQSPIIYKETDQFCSTLLDCCKAYFQPIHTINHYKGIAKNSYLKGLLKGEIKLKKLFYTLRPLMAAKWIMLKNEIPPMDITSLLPIIDDRSIIYHIQKLLELKKSVNEDYTHQLSPLLSTFISKEFENLQNFQGKERAKNMVFKSDHLNDFFKRIIEE